MNDTTNTSNTLEIPAEVRTFLEGMTEDAGMNLVVDDMKEEMVKELYLRLDAYITSVIATALSEKNLAEFIKMNEDKKPKAEVEQFLQDNVPNSKELFAKAFSDFRALYIGNVKKHREGQAGN